MLLELYEVEATRTLSERRAVAKKKTFPYMGLALMVYLDKKRCRSDVKDGGGAGSKGQGGETVRAKHKSAKESWRQKQVDTSCCDGRHKKKTGDRYIMMTSIQDVPDHERKKIVPHS
jgi:hypothetical protein